MLDPTDSVRRLLIVLAHRRARTREELEARHGQVWNSLELARDFDVLGCFEPLVVVVRRADDRLGSLEYQEVPRLYYHFRPEEH